MVIACQSWWGTQSPVLAANTNAKDMYWIGGSGEWNDAEHWLTKSGGKAAHKVPGKSENAIFDDNSGSGTVRLSKDITIANIRVNKNAKELTFSQTAGVLTVKEDAVFSAGSLDKENHFNISVGRNLDTAALFTKLNKGKYLNVSLTGTGYWRYSLKSEHKPKVNIFKAAYPGNTTTLRPVEIAPQGVDIDVVKCQFGDKTSCLNMDISEVTQKGKKYVTLEIHQRRNLFDIESNGCKLAVTALEHEVWGKGPHLLQHNLDLTELKVYDITGGYKTPRGKGPTWEMSGPLNMPGAHLALDKTVVLNTKGFELRVASIAIGSNGGIAELVMGKGKVTADSVSIGSKEYPGHLYLGTGTLVCKNLRISKGTSIDGQKGSTLEVTGSIRIGEGVKLKLGKIKLKGKAKELVQ